MIYIGENIHIISKQVREALENRDENFIKNLIKLQENSDCIDVNIGPSKGKLDKIFEWIVPLISDKNISFDSTNHTAIYEGLKLVKNPQNCFINSTTGDDEKLEFCTDMAVEFGCNLIALSMTKDEGIPKSSDGRLEIVFKIYEKCMEKGISPDKIYFDPLVLPLKAEQSQALEALNTLRMIKESFDPKVNTVVGLSNISNGCPQNLRPLINRVYAVLAYGAGLDAVIMDAKDTELMRIMNAVISSKAEKQVDNVYIKLCECFRNFDCVDDIKFDNEDVQGQNVIKAAKVLLNDCIYSDSFTLV